VCACVCVCASAFACFAPLRFRSFGTNQQQFHKVLCVCVYVCLLVSPHFDFVVWDRPPKKTQVKSWRSALVCVCVCLFVCLFCLFAIVSFRNAPYIRIYLSFSVLPHSLSLTYFADVPSPCPPPNIQKVTS